MKAMRKILQARFLVPAAICMALALAVAGAPAQAQAQAEGGDSAAETAAPSAEASAKIDEILEGEEAVLEGLVSSYEPGGRRDPFRSLLGPARKNLRGPRPPGTAGFLIDEISVKGIFKTSQGFIAHIMVQNQKKSFLLREGDPVYDGDVLRIEQHTVVFRQIVNDPTIIKPFREVVKRLRP